MLQNVFDVGYNGGLGLDLESVNLWGGDCQGFLNTYNQEFELTALERFDQVSDSRLQACTKEDAFAEMVKQDGSEGIGITWSQEREVMSMLNTLIL